MNRDVLREAIIPLPIGVATRKALMEYIGFEGIAAAHPDHELFVVAWKILADNPFAIVFRIPKSLIAERGWPVHIDPVKRWCVVVPDVVAELPAIEHGSPFDMVA